ncbi:AI-2E family transporter [Niallia sp. Krafla_26]|uniref:AI-2E family transporter n=1 Tax=Niallia sp. Krafla_26 TaxID=3064703 RepID=UPI003D177499
MDIRVKWYYRLGFLLLLMIVLFVFVKLKPFWQPLVELIITIFLPFLIAGFITYLLHPIIEKIHEAGLHRGVAVFFIYFLFFGGIGYGVYKGLPEIIKQLKDLAQSVPVFSQQYMEFIHYIQQKTAAWPDGIQKRVYEGISSIEKGLEQKITSIINSTWGILGNVFMIALIPVISFYMLKDYGTIKKAIWYISPRKWRTGGSILLRDIDKSLGGYIRGQILVCVVIGAISSLAFWIFDMKYPLLLGLIIGITNVIPYFGPVFGAIPAVLIAATISVKMVIIVLVIVLLLQFLEGNILAPMIVGKSLHMHPLVIMFALFAGGEIGGILGMILSVPIIAVLKVSLLHLKVYLEKKREVLEPVHDKS